MTLAELNTWVQGEQLKGKKCDLIHYCGAWQRLESLDASYVYYTKIDRNTERSFLPVRFYNFLCDELKGKDVYLTFKNRGGTYVYPTDRTIEEALTGTTIFQKDSLFRCIDVVVNDKLYTCCVLEGEKTGKFAVFVNKFIESPNGNDRIPYFSTTSSYMTIWQPNPYEGGKGYLIRDRHFSVSRYINNEERWLIKAKDLDAIYAETKRFEALTTVQQRQEVEKRKREKTARETKRQQELCSRYGNEFGTIIANRKVALGMTPEMCRQAWGTPIQISNMVDVTGKYTVWKYNFKTCIYFYNGIVAKIKN